MLRLPDVTLVMVETREHKLARLAVEDCLAKVEFGDVLVVTDQPEKFGPHVASSARFHLVPDWPDKLGWSQSWWYDVPPLLKTNFTLNIQWDSWVWDTSCWRDEFYDYDYIGAPWWYTDGRNVGNGGFSFISTRLKQYLAENRERFPCTTSSDDDLLCRKYRPALEQAGFDWAPEEVAHEFSFECCRPSETSRHFGFHAMFNWPHVLPEDRVIERMNIALASPYIKDSYMMKSFWYRHPGLSWKLLKAA
jgi:hypothetical protein